MRVQDEEQDFDWHQRREEAGLREHETYK